MKIEKGYHTGVYRNWIQYRVSEPALRGLTYLGIVCRFLLQRAQRRGQKTSILTAMSVAAEFKEDADSLQTQILSEGMAAYTCG